MRPAGTTARTALLVVDVQNDFCEGGSLAVCGGAGVAADISDYIGAERDRFDLVITSQDWHRPGTSNHGHIAVPPDEPDFQETWPGHCVADTDGAQFHRNLKVAGDRVTIRKGWDEAAYSAFQGADQRGTNLHVLLQQAAIERLAICGIATDFCVNASAHDAVDHGYAVELLVDLTAAVDPTGQDAVVDALRERGVRAR